MPEVSFAAIAVDGTASTSSPASAANLTWSHTNTAGNVMVVTFSNVNQTPSSVTYNGVAMTQAFFRDSGIDGGTDIFGYYLMNPGTGTHDVVVTVSASTYRFGTSITFSGAYTAAIGATTTQEQASGTGITTPITTTSDNSYLVDVIAINTNAPTASGGQTTILAQDMGDYGKGSSYVKIPTAGPTSMGWSFGGTVNSQHGIIEVREGEAAPTTRKIRGVGISR